MYGKMLLFHRNLMELKPPRILARFNSTFKEKPRINPVGIQHLSVGIHNKIFPKHQVIDSELEERSDYVELSKQHLKCNDLLGKKTCISEPIDFNIPSLQGNSLDEHFYKLGMDSADPYLKYATDFSKSNLAACPKPGEWLFKPGWYRYVKNKKPQPVPYPLEDTLTFDVEVLYKISPYPVLATAASTEAWYGWVSPFLTSKGKKPLYSLIPMNTLNKAKLIVGHNVGYDRARIQDEYHVKQSLGFYLDTMSLHIATNGMCSRQRPTWLKHNSQKTKLKSIRSESDGGDVTLNSAEDADLSSAIKESQIENPWIDFSSPNSLALVAKLHCGVEIDKSDRDYFASENIAEIVRLFPKLMAYCASDVDVTHKVFSKVFPEFRRLIPHPVSFASLRHIGTSFLPTNKKWIDYINKAESIYQQNKTKIESKLHALAWEILDYKNNPEKYRSDPWLSQLDWTIKEVKYKKNGEMVKRQARLTGFPQWYRDLGTSTDPKEINLSTRTRISAFLLRLSWEGYPLFWTVSKGWCFKVPSDEDIIDELKLKNYILANWEDDPNADLIAEQIKDGDTAYELFKVPHADGPDSNCASVLSKNYLKFFENGTLTSEYEDAKEILNLNAAGSYWMGARERISSQFVVYNEKDKFGIPHDMGIILPQISTMGTVTRRAVEKTWLTASNAKASRIGSELKSMIESPPGYSFVGADVDSEELWIASLVGDSVFKLHGGTAIGWMTLEGTKNEGTDLHSKTAKILGISRNEAKVFNYGRIYGAGLKFATQLLKQFNPKLTDKETQETSQKLYDATKGARGYTKNNTLWYGGSESIVFNRLEKIAQENDPKTPVLGAGITSALKKKNLKGNIFLPSRINWAIQSSGVDYLHLLLVSMEYLIKKYQIDARLAITVHDEIRYMVKDEDKYKVALLLQIGNLWTRAMFSQQLGINDVPQSCAFFSAVDIDKVLRKEVDMDCVTPSNSVPIPHGESLDIHEVLKKSGDIGQGINLDFSHIKYMERQPAFLSLDDDLSESTKKSLISLQLANNKDDFANRRKLYYSRMKNNASELFFQDQVSSTGTKKCVIPPKTIYASSSCNSNIFEGEKILGINTKTFKKSKKRQTNDVDSYSLSDEELLARLNMDKNTAIKQIKRY